MSQEYRRIIRKTLVEHMGKGNLIENSDVLLVKLYKGLQRRNQRLINIIKSQEKELRKEPRQRY